ncbi:MAG: LysR family transcriptional regulator [Hydrogenophaga sp.]|jgi:LysR family nitrogen assimilation transcriptional regulator|nr:LysR family transcriptional regulator [Hydrogenophaga sp.]
MNLRTLRYFVAVADAGSLTAAAAAIPIAQPALTRQVRELEAQLGVPLFNRLPRGVRLTQAGVILYESAQRILQEADQLRQRLARQLDGTRSTVVLGVPPTLSRIMLPGLFEQCLATLPDLELKTREAFTPTLLDWLERGLIDMAVVTNPESGRALNLTPLLGEPFTLVTPARMHMPPTVSLAQLERLPLLMTTLHHDLVEKQLRPLGKRLPVRALIDSVDSIREMVALGNWATIMPVSVFKDAGADLVMSEITGVQINRLLVLACRREPQNDRAMRLIEEMVEQQFRRLIADGVFSLYAHRPPVA